MKDKVWAGFFLLWLLVFGPVPQVAYGAELDGETYELGMEVIEDEAVQQAIDQLFDPGERIGFKDIVSQLLTGDFSQALGMFKTYLWDKITYEVMANQRVLLQMMGIALIGAVFTNFSLAFEKNDVSLTGFYMTYILLFTLLMGAFTLMCQMVEETLAGLLNFMAALLPVFCVAMGLAAGHLSSAGYYQLMSVILTLVAWLIKNAILPLVNVYVVVFLMNQLSGEDYLSGFTELLETVISWSMKTVIGAVLGFNMMQTLLLSALDGTKSSLLLKAVSVVPGLGNVVNTTAKTVIGAGVLIKNAVGIGGVLILLLITAMPLIKLVLMTLMYKLAAALIQPVSDERIVSCMQGIGQGSALLLKILGGSLLIFVLSMAVVLSATNGGY